MRHTYEERTEGGRSHIGRREEALYAAEVPSAKELRGAHAEARLAHAHRKSPQGCGGHGADRRERDAGPADE